MDLVRWWIDRGIKRRNGFYNHVRKTLGFSGFVHGSHGVLSFVHGQSVVYVKSRRTIFVRTQLDNIQTSIVHNYSKTKYIKP